jgi:hypothetical protein
MTDWALIDKTYPADDPAQLALQDALRDDDGDDSDFVVQPPPGWGEPQHTEIIWPDMPPAIVRLNHLNGVYMCGGGNIYCGQTFGRIVQAWRDSPKTRALIDAQAANARGDYATEAINLAIAAATHPR